MQRFLRVAQHSQTLLSLGVIHSAMIHGALQHQVNDSNQVRQCCSSEDNRRETSCLGEMERTQSHSGVTSNRKTTTEGTRVITSISGIPKNVLLTRLDLFSRNRGNLDVSPIPAVIDDVLRGNTKMLADILSSNSIEISTSFTRIPPVPVSANTEQGCAESPCFLERLMREIMEKSRR